MDKFLGFKTEEILTCFLLVVVGYFIAKMFSRSCANRVDGFSVGGNYVVKCEPSKDSISSCEAKCGSNGAKDSKGATIPGCGLNAVTNIWGKDDTGTNIYPKPEAIPGIGSVYTPKNGNGLIAACCDGNKPAPAPPPPPPAAKYTCVRDSRGNPGSCISGEKGDFNTLKDCQDNCKALGCTYTGDNKTKTNSRSFKDYANEEKFDTLKCPKFQVKIDECKDAWKNYYDDKNVPYDGSFCMQTLPDETKTDELKGRGHCPFMHNASGKPYPANWITNGQNFTIDEAKNRCKLSYLKGGGVPVGTIDEQENAPGRYAWVSETNKNDCDCPGSPAPTPAPINICKDKKLMDGTSKPGTDKGDCPGQTRYQTCCYDKSTIPNDFYQHYKNETQDMINKCEKDLKGKFTGPTSSKDVKKLGFPKLTGKNKFGKSIAGNELFCYYNDSEKHPNEHKNYCDSKRAYEKGHGYFCSFPSNKKHNRNRHNLRDLRNTRNMLRDELSQLETQA